VISDLKPYPAMKNSCVPWLEGVPEHWVVAPGRACLTETHKPNTGLIEKTVLSLSYGQIVVKPEDKLHGLVPASFETYQIVEPGDIICRPTDLQNDKTSLRFGLSDYRGIITSAYICLRTLDCIDRRFAHLLLHAYDLKKIFYGLGSGLRQNLDWRDFKTLPCLLPPLPEQVAIVRFLDHVDGRVRRYIRFKQKLIKLLEEQKQVIIHHAVTRGLDPDVRLKPSGVEWLGDVPEHWEVRKLGQIAVSFRTGPFGSILHQSDYVEEGTPVINPTHMSHGRIVEDMRCSVPPTVADRLNNYRLEQHDIIFSRRGELGRCALVRDREVGWLCGTGSIRVRFAYDEIEPEYLIQLLQVRWIGEYLSLYSVGATMDNLNTGILKEVPVLLPPINEQRTLLVWIANEGQRIDSASAVAEREISLLREYRTRLISDVVTGKLDVRGLDLTAAADAEAPEECIDLQDIETALEDQEMEEEVPAEGD